MAQRIKTVQESDLRMLGALARSIQRVLPVTQEDIDAAAALGKGWVVTRVFEVTDPLDNLRGGTQLVIRQNSVLPGQSVQRVLLVSGPGGQTVVVRGSDYIALPDAIANSLSYVKAFGGTEQRNLPDNYIERQFIYMMDGSYLLTDIVPTPDCKIEFDFQTLTIVSSARTYLGCRDTSGSNDGLRVAHISSGNFRIYGFGTYTDSATAVQSNTRYKFVWNNKQATITTGGTTVFDNTFAAEGTNQTAVAINGWNTADTVDANSEGIYLYSFKVWDNQGNLIADYVPAVQKGTVPVVGFYDTVSKTFKTATAGTFAAGGEAVPTPDTPMDIVSNNGTVKVSRNLYSGVNDEEGYLTDTGTVITDNRGTTSDYIEVLPSTTYTLKLLRTAEQIYTRVCSYNSSKNFVSLLVKDTSTAAGYVTATFTTDATAKYIRISFKSDSTEVQLEQGSVATPYHPYGEIYTDGTVETINVCGKNLFDPTKVLFGYYRDRTTGNKTQSSQNFMSSDDGYIPCLPNTTYTFVGTNKTDGTYSKYNTIYFFDSAKNYLAASPYEILQPTTGTTPNNCYYLQVRSNPLDNSTPIQDAFAQFNWQLEQGSTATTYEPYYNGGTATTEMLLKVGDYQDVQSILDGVVTRNVGIKVLDGTENWQTFPNSGRFYLSNAFQNLISYGSGAYTIAICSHFPANPDAISGALGFVFYKNFPDEVAQLRITYPSVVITTAFKQYLADQYAAGHPVIIVYPLATATTESVTGQTLQVQAGDNILEITQASLNGLELEAEYQAAVSLTIQEVQDANLDPNVEVTIN